jgi:CRISPR/Cas system CSM-associated protein Csm4 (group 5 of RAMP superfamily)
MFVPVSLYKYNVCNKKQINYKKKKKKKYFVYKRLSTLVRNKLELSFVIKILSVCEIAKIQIANITCTYSGDKSQKYAAAEKTSYMVYAKIYVDSTIRFCVLLSYC